MKSDLNIDTQLEYWKGEFERLQKELFVVHAVIVKLELQKEEKN